MTTLDEALAAEDARSPGFRRAVVREAARLQRMIERDARAAATLCQWPGCDRLVYGKRYCRPHRERNAAEIRHAVARATATPLKER